MNKVLDYGSNYRCLNHLQSIFCSSSDLNQHYNRERIVSYPLDEKKFFRKKMNLLATILLIFSLINFITKFNDFIFLLLTIELFLISLSLFFINIAFLYDNFFSLFFSFIIFIFAASESALGLTIFIISIFI